MRALRISISALAIVCSATIQAQHSTPPLYLSASGPVDHFTTKRVYEVIQGMDPTGEVIWHGTDLELRLNDPTDRDAVLDELNALGSVHFNRFSRGATLSLPAPPSEDMPQHIDTGDPEADEIRLAEAKQAWLRRHPEQYNRFTQQRGKP